MPQKRSAISNIKGASVKPDPIRREEWDFRRMPEAELVECCLYEYARELLKNSPELRELLARYAATEKAPTGTALRHKSFAAYRRFMEKLAPRERGPYVHGEMQHVPWQCLKSELREELLPKPRPSNGVKQGAEIPGLALPAFIQPTRRGGRGMEFTFIQPPFDCQSAAEQFLDFRTRTHACAKLAATNLNSVQFGIFALDWDYPLNDLRNAFLDWLDTQAEKFAPQHPPKSQRGKVKADAPRGWLKALGAKRLLESGMTVPQAIKYTERFGPPLFAKAPEWSKAKNETFPTVAVRLFGRS